MRIWFKLYASWTLVLAQIAAGFCVTALAGPPRGTTLCSRPPPYVGNYSPINESTPFAGSRLFRLDDGRRHLSLILLHGSEGGSDPEFAWYARLWAKLGYAVLAYCYFDCSREPLALPATLKNVETSRVLDAVAWLRQQSFSDGKVALFGFSMGAELALIVGTLQGGEGEPNALIAHSPGQFFDPPFNPNWVKPSCWTCIGDCKTKAPRDPDPNFAWHPQCGGDTPDTLDYQKSGWLVHGMTTASGTRIPIEKFSGPILLIQGEEDTAWHGRGQTRDIEASLKKSGKSPMTYYFPGAGHDFAGTADMGCEMRLVQAYLRNLDRSR
jgi:dienelactone hydrolase